MAVVLVVEDNDKPACWRDRSSISNQDRRRVEVDSIFHPYRAPQLPPKG